MRGGRHELAQCLPSHFVLSRFVETWPGVSPLFGVTLRYVMYACVWLCGEPYWFPFGDPRLRWVTDHGNCCGFSVETFPFVIPEAHFAFMIFYFPRIHCSVNVNWR